MKIRQALKIIKNVRRFEVSDEQSVKIINDYLDADVHHKFSDTKLDYLLGMRYSSQKFDKAYEIIGRVSRKHLKKQTKYEGSKDKLPR